LYPFIAHFHSLVHTITAFLSVNTLRVMMLVSADGWCVIFHFPFILLCELIRQLMPNNNLQIEKDGEIFASAHVRQRDWDKKKYLLAWQRVGLRRIFVCFDISSDGQLTWSKSERYRGAHNCGSGSPIPPGIAVMWEAIKENVRPIEYTL
jgi:hypothetical protein